VVEYQQFERLGGSHAVQVDVRIIGATNADLPQLAAEGKFKRDFRDRLSFEVLFLPPFLHRKEDIELLARHFATRMAMELGWRKVPQFIETAMEALESYQWPGNIREMKNTVERAVYASGGGAIKEVNFDPFDSPFSGGRTSPEKMGGDGANGPGFVPERDLLEERIRDLEVQALKAALEETKYHQGEAPLYLGFPITSSADCIETQGQPGALACCARSTVNRDRRTPVSGPLRRWPGRRPS
jgi:psp operon transcriptional activator